MQNISTNSTNPIAGVMWVASILSIIIFLINDRIQYNRCWYPLIIPAHDCERFVECIMHRYPHPLDDRLCAILQSPKKIELAIELNTEYCEEQPHRRLYCHSPWRLSALKLEQCGPKPLQVPPKLAKACAKSDLELILIPMEEAWKSKGRGVFPCSPTDLASRSGKRVLPPTLVVRTRGCPC